MLINAICISFEIMTFELSSQDLHWLKCEAVICNYVQKYFIQSLLHMKLHYIRANGIIQ
jgi:hypothetical protein